MFIKYAHEANVKKFFMNDIDKLLEKYEPGLPKMKPDVLKQTKEIEEQRAEAMRKMQMDPANTKIMINRPGEAPRELKPEEIVTLLQEQQKEIDMLRNGGFGGGGGGIPKIMINKPGEPPREMTIEEIVNTLQEQQRELEYHRNSHSGFSNIPSTPLNGPSPFGSFPSTPTIPTMPTPMPTPIPTMKEEKEEEFPTSCYPFIPPIPKKENPSFPSSNFPPPPSSPLDSILPKIPTTYKVLNENQIEIHKLGDLPKKIGLKEIVSLLEEQQKKIDELNARGGPGPHSFPNSGMNEFKIMVNRPGEAPREASPQEIISIIQEQQTHINTMTQHHETEIVEYKKKINELETLLFESNIKLANVGKTNTSSSKPNTSDKININLSNTEKPNTQSKSKPNKSMPLKKEIGISD
jgi:hypothetical protein